MITELGGLIARLMKSNDATYIQDANDIAYFANTGDQKFLRGLDTIVRDMVFDELMRVGDVEFAERTTGFTANTY